MKKRFIYHDEKSNKFWWIDYEGDSLAVNYGKVGSIGKFQTKEFDNEEQCLKEASKLIAAKMKKGYQEDPKFNFMDRYYFDDEEIGLHVKTLHPNFQCHFTDPLYMCCWDEESPFGSDEGADALNVLENSLRKEPDLDCADFPQMLIETMWGMKYIAMDSRVQHGPVEPKADRHHPAAHARKHAADSHQQPCQHIFPKAILPPHCAPPPFPFLFRRAYARLKRPIPSIACPSEGCNRQRK